jgi:predicted secreted protein
MEDTSDKISSARGEKFKISLEAVAPAGYRWQPIYDKIYLKLISDEVTPASEKMGAGGIEQFIFQSIKPGNTIIEMSYKRPWEKSASKHKKIFVEIK